MPSRADSSLNQTTLDRLLGTFQNELNVQESYHNHKETMAWTATSLYLGFTVLFVGRVLAFKHEEMKILFDKNIGVAEVLAFCVLALIYIFTIVFIAM